MVELHAGQRWNGVGGRDETGTGRAEKSDGRGWREREREFGKEMKDLQWRGRKGW